MGIFGNNDSESKSFKDTIEKLKADYEALSQENKAKDEKIVKLQKVVEVLRHDLESRDRDSSNTPIIEPETLNPEQRVVLTEPQAIDYMPTLEAIEMAIKELKEQSEEIKLQVLHREVQEENMKAMHKELEKFRGDFYVKITQPYLMAMLDLHKRFYDTFTHFDKLNENEADKGTLYSNLMEEFKSAVMALENRIYNDFGVEYFVPVENEEFDPRAHKPIDVVETNNSGQHRKVASVIYGGFRNIDTGNVLRTARITCYKLTGTKE